MKTMLRPTALALLATVSVSFGQLKKLNEICKETPCESGLYCVELKNGDRKCAECNQDTLNDLTRKVDDACKSFDSGWTPEKSSDYNDALAKDGRVLVDVYDRMLEKAKQCKEARVYRERTCWRGGDSEHKGAIQQVEESISRISAHKNKMIEDRRVYYGSKSTYESRLSTFISKSELNFPDINQKLSIMNNEQGKGNKVNCSEIEKYRNDCERCIEAGKALSSDGFSNSSGKFPEIYNQSLLKAEEAAKKANELLSAVKSKNLCN